MKTFILVTVLAVTLCHSASIPKKGVSREDEQKIKELEDLFEIDIETKPEDGSLKGLRIRRSGEKSLTGNEEEDINFPDIDIQKINDGTIKVNGVAVRRNDLSDVELDDDALAAESEDDSEIAGSDRTRRSGDLLGFIGHKLQQKLSLIASASSGHNAESDLHYGPPVTSYNTKAFDIWAFKKAILSTLLQAVKAIKGGVIALGGQIIKAKGHLITTKGKIIATKGESISEFGRHIAANALLTHPQASAPATAFANAAIEHDGGYSAGVSSGYGTPAVSVQSSYGSSSVSGGYGVPQHGYTKRGANAQQFGVPQDLPNGVQAGLLVLKPINVPEGGNIQQQQQQQHQGYAKRKVHQQTFASRDSQSASSDIEPSSSDIEERSYYVRRY